MTAPARELDDFETPIYQWFEQIILNTESEVRILPFVSRITFGTPCADETILRYH